MFHPSRGGTRGGQDQFKWEDVKDDKHRENYLGNSLLAPVGRWQKGRDLTWYAKANGDNDANTSEQDKKRAEIQSIKDAEAQAMAEALGYKTAKRKTESNVTENELQSAIHKNDPGVSDALDGKLQESSRIQGLGFNRRPGLAMDSQKEAFRTNLTKPIASVPLIPATATISATKDSDRDRHSHERHSSREHRSGHRRSSRSASPSRKSSKRDRDRSRSRERTRTSDRRETSHRGRDDDSTSKRRSGREDKGAKDNRDRGNRTDERRSERRSRSPRVRHERSDRDSRDEVSKGSSTRERRHSRSRSRDRHHESDATERYSKSRRDERTRS